MDMKRKILSVTGIALFAALALLIWRLDIPHWQRLDISRVTGQSVTTTVYDVNDTAVGALHGGENRKWIGLSGVPRDVQNAFIAAEDLRFYRHHGVDLYRVMGALWQDIRTMSYAQGASTITQQLIKLTHLSQAKTLSRKAQEIVLALQLEKVMDKQEILEAYLNTVYFGHGAYGIETAANVYFDKSASELTLAEGALLAGVIKSPSGYAPHLNREKSISRRNSILDTMAENDMITEEQRVDAQSKPLHLAHQEEDDARFAWYMDTVLQEAARVLNVTADEIMSGGYGIHTGLDADMQASAEALFGDADRFPSNADDGTPVQASLVCLDTDSGEVRAVVGGRQYDVRRGLNRAVDITRQPGSAFKPVSTYAAAIDAYGYVPVSIIDDTPRTFSGGYAPRNAGGASYGPVTLREALSRSLNVATVDLADAIGTPALRTYAQRFGLPLAAEDINLSLALGSLTYGVSPARLCAAYCALANGGMRVDAHAIRWIGDADGNVVYRAGDAHERAVRPETAYMVTDMLKTAATKGSARALAQCGVPVAGKTGTVSESGGGTRDVWTVAYTPDIAVSVWMGYDDPGSGHSLPASEGGGGYPARLCAAYIDSLSQKIGRAEFRRPSGIRKVMLDGLTLEEDRTALLSTERTPADAVAQELFRDGDMPTQFSDKWTAPAPVRDFQLLTGPGETPVLGFTVLDDGAEYVVTRTVNGRSDEVAVLRGKAGQELLWTDDRLDTTQLAYYRVLPRNALLYERGELLAGPVSQSVEYVPGGLLNAIMGVGEAEASPAPTQVETQGDQSLFS